MARLLVPRMKGGRPERQKAVTSETRRVLGKVGGDLGGGHEVEPHILSPDIIHVTAAGREKAQW